LKATHGISSPFDPTRPVRVVKETEGWLTVDGHQSDSLARQAGRGLWFASLWPVAVNLIHLPDKPGGVRNFIPLNGY
jgi:hypothetical protein